MIWSRIESRHSEDHPTELYLRIFVTGIQSNMTHLELRTERNGVSIFSLKKSRVRIFKFALENIALLYAGLNPSSLGKLKILKMELQEFAIRNGNIFRSELRRSYFCDLPIQLIEPGNFEISILNDSRPLWLSRSILHKGAAPITLSHEIERSRARQGNLFSGFAWVKLQHLDLDSLVADSKFAINEIREFDLTSFPKSINVIELQGSAIPNGEYVIWNDSFLQSRPSESLEKVSWPTEKPFQLGPHKIISLLGKEIRSLNSTEYIFVSSETNWFHFMLEVLPIYLRLGEGFYKGKTAIISAGHPTQIKNLILLLTGKPPIEVKHGQCLKVEKLSVGVDRRFGISFNFKERSEDISLLKKFFLSESFKSSLNSYPKIYISRPDTSYRKCVNSKEIREFLEMLNFKVIDPGHMELEEQIFYFRNAKLIVAEAGAALANLLFTSHGATLVEIRPPDVEDFWSDFIGILKINHELVVGKKQKNKFKNVMNSGYKVELKELSDCLNKIDPKLIGLL